MVFHRLALSCGGSFFFAEHILARKDGRIWHVLPYCATEHSGGVRASRQARGLTSAKTIDSMPVKQCSTDLLIVVITRWDLRANEATCSSELNSQLVGRVRTKRSVTIVSLSQNTS